MHKKQLFSVVAMATVIGGVGVLQAQEPQHPKPEVSGVTMKQVAYSSQVEISYKLTGAAAIITLAIETNGVAIPDSAVTRLSGDVSVVVQPGEGTKSITWNAGADWPENMTDVAMAKVTAWTLDSPPQYAAVDVLAGTSATEYPVYFYPSEDGLPDGVTHEVYKTTTILLRRIEPTGLVGFRMGSPSNETGRNVDRESQVTVVLSKAYFMGVYQVTQQQWQLVMGDVRSWPANWNNNDYRLTRPVEMVSYFDARENANNSAIEPNWPQSSTPGPNSFMGRLCAKAGGVLAFDLPTDAQWEWACRAGTTGALNDGTVNLANSSSDPNLDLLGRYERNGGKVEADGKYSDPAPDCTTENATAAVGSYLPNAWGLYDMHGNVLEWCLNWFDNAISDGTDPFGPEEPVNGNRVRRGGCWNSAASACRSASRSFNAPSLRYYTSGLRVAAAPVVQSPHN